MPFEIFDERIEREQRQPHRPQRDPGDVDRALERDAFRHHLAEDDVPERQDAQRDRGGERRAADRRDLPDHRFHEIREPMFAVHAQAQAGERDAELRGRDVAILARRRAQHVENFSGEAVTAGGAVFECGPRRGQQRELGGDEQAVHQNQHGADQQDVGHAGTFAG